MGQFYLSFAVFFVAAYLLRDLSVSFLTSQPHWVQALLLVPWFIGAIACVSAVFFTVVIWKRRIGILLMPQDQFIEDAVKRMRQPEKNDENT